MAWRVRESTAFIKDPSSRASSTLFWPFRGLHLNVQTTIYTHLKTILKLGRVYQTGLKLTGICLHLSLKCLD